MITWRETKRFTNTLGVRHVIHEATHSAIGLKLDHVTRDREEWWTWEVFGIDGDKKIGTSSGTSYRSMEEAKACAERIARVKRVLNIVSTVFFK